MTPRAALVAPLLVAGLLGMAPTPDPAEAQALAQALALPAPALRAVAAHAARVEAARAGGQDPDAACKLVESALAARAGLFDALAPRLAEAEAAERAEAGTLLAALAGALPGVAAQVPADPEAPFEAGVDYAALAAVLPAKAPGRALLVVAGRLRAPVGTLAYVRPPAAAGLPPCADFAPVLGGLAQLPGAWRAAPARLRARMLQPLRDAVVRMGEQADFCRDEPAARAAARDAARLLGKLPAFGGPGTGRRIGHNFRSYGLRFGLAP